MVGRNDVVPPALLVQAEEGAWALGVVVVGDAKRDCGAHPREAVDKHAEQRAVAEELGGSLGYADAARAVSRGARRTLVAHGDAAYHEWGAGATGMGGAERLWSVRDAGERAHGYGFDAGMRVVAELGYGLNAFRGRNTMTPSSGLASAQAGAICASAWAGRSSRRYASPSRRRGAGRCRPTTGCG